jgi:undecaprenyl-diphosphatase
MFLILVMMVMSGWPELRAFDEAVIDAANAVVSAWPWMAVALSAVTNAGGSVFAWCALGLAVVWLGLRRQWALTAYVALTGAGAAALTAGTKALVERDRPVPADPVAMAPGLSFPSGHALGSAVSYGVLLLVFVPIVPRRWRRWVVGMVSALVVTIGVSRIGLGVHYPTDVVGGWLLALWWLSVTAIVFRRWHDGIGRGAPPLIDGLEPEEREQLLPAPTQDRPLPAGWYSLAYLAVTAILIWGALVALGAFVRSWSTVGTFDAAVADWFVGIRSESATDILLAVSRLGDTSTVVAILMASVALALALSRRWRPAVFLVAVVVGEVILFLASARVVGRERPEVNHLTPGLPPTSSFPSGHVAATVGLYGALAVLAVVFARGVIRYAAMATAIAVVVAVAIARLYMGVHYISDVVVSIAYTTAWVTLCWWVVRPQMHTVSDVNDPHRGRGHHGDSEATNPSPRAWGRDTECDCDAANDLRSSERSRS